MLQMSQQLKKLLLKQQQLINKRMKRPRESPSHLKHSKQDLT